MSVLSRAARAFVRGVVVILLILLAALPSPALPLLFFLQKWRDKEVAASVAKKR